MEQLRDTLMNELRAIESKGSINDTDLGRVDKLTHAIKSIDTIKAMREGGYSNGYYARRGSDGRYTGYSTWDKLDRMLDEASTESERDAIRQAMSRVHR